MTRRRLMVDTYPRLWIAVALLLGWSHVAAGFRNLGRDRPFGTLNVVAAATFAALAVWIGCRARARTRRGET